MTLVINMYKKTCFNLQVWFLLNLLNVVKDYADL